MKNEQYFYYNILFVSTLSSLSECVLDWLCQLTVCRGACQSEAQLVSRSLYTEITYNYVG